MRDQSFDIYSERYVHLYGDIKDGCLHLESLVFGEEYDSEKHYSFTKEETERLFEILPLKEFIELCRHEHVSGMEAFFTEHGLEPATFTF